MIDVLTAPALCGGGDQAGVEYAFWSAHAMIQEQQRIRSEAATLGVDPVALRKLLQQQQLEQEQEQERLLKQGAARGESRAVGTGPGFPVVSLGAAVNDDPRIRILDVEELLDRFELKCSAAVAAAGPDDPRASEGLERRHMVGLVGYPNVGKSSTINALFGAKKTAVAATPGKTKHFQTLHVSPEVILCDCPGLVMPKFARSRAEMVAAGVVPIDRLTDIRQPVDVVATRVGRAQLTAVYGIKLPQPMRHEAPDAQPSAGQVLRCDHRLPHC